ncbi:S41 family peptidase [Paraliomyxa miuraensis]|nr:S41 family peptidase [Paraliomyxa miuraensis]
MSCKEPEATGDARAAPAAATTPDVPPPECHDWSTLDLSEVPPLVEGAQAPLLDEVWRTVLEKHFDPTLGCLQWDELREVYAQKVAKASSDAEAYAHINAMLDELGQSHLRLFPPSRNEESMGPASPALTVRWIEDQLVVVESRADGPQGPVHAGATLLAIDDEPVGRLVERVRGRTEPNALALEVSRAVAVRLSCERAGMTHKLKVTDPTKSPTKPPAKPDDGVEPQPQPQPHLAIRIVPCLPPEGERVTLGNLRDIPTRVEHRMLDGDVGLLAFNVWMLPMVQEVTRAMAEMRGEGMRGLVIDLRGNPGGVGTMVVPVARLLLREDGSLGTLRFRDFEQKLAVDGQPQAFDGPVAVLVDEGTASASELFVVGLHDLGRITVVGAHPSAGAALPSLIEELHGGALLQYVVADFVSPKGTVVEGKGVVPDVPVVETREDFAAGRDPVLEAAQRHVVGALGPPPTLADPASPAPPDGSSPSPTP